MIISINISDEQIKRAEQIAKQRRMTTGEQANRSSEIGRAIDALFLSECLINMTDGTPTEKTVTPIFETAGKRRKLIGFDASYNGFIIGRFDTEPAARTALDAYAYEESAA